MNVYLDYFQFPSPDDEFRQFVCGPYVFRMTCYKSFYPFKVLPDNIRELEMGSITILYGSNGSGKTTMLNVIAETLGINRSTKINKSAVMDHYVDLCDYSMIKHPDSLKMITSDDVFSEIFLTREKNEIIDKKRDELLDFKSECNIPEPEALGIMMKKMIGDGNWIENIDVLRKIADAQNPNMTHSQYVNKWLEKNIKGKSNGETAMKYFAENVNEPGLYLLDEPENSLSASYQRQLSEYLFDSARFFGAQLIISTHSPFMLSMPNALIYNLDAQKDFVTDDWTKLDGMKEYYKLFSKYAEEFEGR